MPQLLLEPPEVSATHSHSSRHSHSRATQTQFAVYDCIPSVALIIRSTVRSNLGPKHQENNEQTENIQPARDTNT